MIANMKANDTLMKCFELELFSREFFPICVSLSHSSLNRIAPELRPDISHILFIELLGVFGGGCVCGCACEWIPVLWRRWLKSKQK